jgi:tetrahydromethanopterin S-methyltransferase subunit G
MEALLERGTDVENWNDERLDELSRRMDAGFDKAATKVELTALKNEMNLRFDEVGGRFDEVGGRFNEFGKRFDKIEDRLDRLNSTLLIGLFGLIAAVIANGIWG